MERLLVSSGSPYEPVFEYSRAVRVGAHVLISGTAPIRQDGGAPPAGAYGQTRLCLKIIQNALREAGAGPEHVVRADLRHGADDFEEVARAVQRGLRGDPTCERLHRRGGPPRSRWRVELEAEAYVS